jgi:hypothetical protein
LLKRVLLALGFSKWLSKFREIEVFTALNIGEHRVSNRVDNNALYEVQWLRFFFLSASGKCRDINLK